MRRDAVTAREMPSAHSLQDSYRPTVGYLGSVALIGIGFAVGDPGARPAALSVRYLYA